MVLDTNVLVSGIAYPTSNPGKILAAWRRGSVTVVLSHHIVEELSLSLPRMNHRLNWRPQQFAEEIELLAQAEHDRWNASKRQQGYTYAPGDKRDVEPRTHPCLLPWSELPEHERDKDRITVRAIPEFLETAGFRVIKLP